VLLSGTAAGLAGSIPAFAADMALWATSLMLINIPRKFSALARLVGITNSILFGISPARIFWGAQLLPITSPLPFLPIPSLFSSGWPTHSELC
jgi:hypothetical protein